MSEFIINKVTLVRSYKPLLEDIDLRIGQRQRIALIGRNGVGKSSFLKLLLGELTQDSGSVEKPQGYRIAALMQDLPIATNQTVANWLARDIANMYEADWQYQNKVEQMAQELNLDLAASVSSLSGGMVRRVLLGAALIAEPDLLILDEPTNHLDIDTIQWLENKVNNYPGSVLMVTHDRRFLENVANMIIELDRGKLTSYACDYNSYLDRKEAHLLAEARQHELFTKELEREEAWIRQGIKARRTRNEGRVRRLEAMRREYQAFRKPLGKAKGVHVQVARSGQIVLEVDNLSYQINSKDIIKPISFELMRGERLGILGPNGCGKSTLVKLLLNKIHPTKGTVKLGTGLKIAYFDQYRDLINLQKTLYDNVANGADYVMVNGRSVHVAGYLKRFLFNPEQFQQLAVTLSGGERNRLMLAKLLASELNFLILDEPTNDLDIETLELLENILLDYEGTLILISHDRAFINQAVTHLLVYENDKFVEFPGDYDAYQAYQATKKSADKLKNDPITIHTKKQFNANSREVQAILKKIAILEQEIDKINEELADPELYSQNTIKMIELNQELKIKQINLDNLYQSWENLEAGGN